MTTVPARILVVAPKGRLRDGMRVLLEALPEVKEVALADNCRTVQQLVAQTPPAIMVWDEDIPVEGIEDVCDHGLPYRGTPCIVLSGQWPHRSSGDCCWVLLKGFSTRDLYKAVYHFLNRTPVEPV